MFVAVGLRVSLFWRSPYLKGRTAAAVPLQIVSSSATVKYAVVCVCVCFKLVLCVCLGCRGRGEGVFRVGSALRIAFDLWRTTRG